MIVGYATSEIYFNDKLRARYKNPIVDNGINALKFNDFYHFIYDTTEHKWIDTRKKNNGVWVQDID